MTTPNQIRSVLQRLARSAKADIRAVASASQDPAEVRASLFAAAPFIVGDYTDGSSALALEWYEELRETADTASAFAPQPLTLVTDEDVAARVAQATASLREIEQDLERALAESLTLLEEDVERLVVDSFTETMTQNAEADPDAVGWRRFARPEACKFCLMLAARGAVYTRETARFAAHGAVTNGKRTGGNCMCIAGPEFGGKSEWAEATPQQYVASKRRRSEKERAALRKYLNRTYPDAPG